MDVVVGEKARLCARLLAARVAPEVADKRRRELREKGRVRGVAPSALRLALCEWSVLITNAPAELLTVEEALCVMRARWQIEKLFDLWKSYGHLGKSRSKKPWRILCEVYAKLLALLIQHWAFLCASAFWVNPYRSVVKACRTVRARALSLADALDAPARLRGALEIIARCLGSGCRVEKQRKRPGTAQQLLAFGGGRREAAAA